MFKLRLVPYEIYVLFFNQIYVSDARQVLNKIL